jgi:hypothetical protein
VTFKALVAQAGGPATAVDDDDAEAVTDEDVATCDGADGELDGEDDEQPAASAAQASAAASRPAPASGTAGFTRPAPGFLRRERSTLTNTFCLPLHEAPERPAGQYDNQMARPVGAAPAAGGSTMNRAQATWPVRPNSRRVRPAGPVLLSGRGQGGGLQVGLDSRSLRGLEHPLGQHDHGEVTRRIDQE